MGAVSSSDYDGASIEPRGGWTSAREASRQRPWTLPSACHDEAWLKVNLSALVGLQEGCSEGGGTDSGHATSWQREGVEAGGAAATQQPLTAKSSLALDDEESDRLASSLCLSMCSLRDEDMAALVDYVKNRMFASLSRLCRRHDVFSESVMKRMKVLRCVHAAMARRRQGLAARTRAKSVLSCPTGAVEAKSGRLVEKSDAPRASGENKLGLQLFFSLLEFVRDPECGQEQVADFLRQISPVLSSLSPLCLAPSTLSPTGEGSIASPAAQGLAPGVVDSLRDFFAGVATAPSPSSESMQTEFSRRYGQSQLTGEIDPDQQELALSAMINLVIARGRASDVLTLVKVLLHHGNRGREVASTAEEIRSSYHADSTPQKFTDHHTTECSAKIRPASRVKARTSRQGLPVGDDDDEKDHDEEDQRKAHPSHLLQPAVPVMLEPTVLETADGSMREAWKDVKRALLPTTGSNISAPSEAQMLMAKKMKGERADAAHPVDQRRRQSKDQLGRQVLAGNTAPGGSRTQRTEAGIRACFIVPLLNQLGRATVSGYDQKARPGLRHEREVWTCGQNSYGELGHDDTGTRKVHCLVKALEGKEVIDVAAGNEHTVLLSREGEVFTAGYNDNGQCGQGTTQRVGTLTRVPVLAGTRAVKVHAYNGCEHTLVVLEDRTVVSFGYNYRGQLGHGNTASESVPKPIRSLERMRVTQVSCSYYHTIIACDNCETYAFGRNDFGQLGCGDTVDRKVPSLVGGLREQRITSLACGQYHTVVSIAKLGVRSCGKNDYGQLGVKSPDFQKEFVAMSGGLEDTDVRCVCSGYYHTIVLASDGHVLGFGRNDYGQLGLGHMTQRVFGPRLIDGVEGKGICRVSAGCYHTILIGSDGVLYVCGRNHHGQLGTGDTHERHFPCAVDTFRGKRVAKVAAGFYHTIVLTGGGDESKSDLPSSSEARTPSAHSILAHPALRLPHSLDDNDMTSLTGAKTSSEKTSKSMSPEINLVCERADPDAMRTLTAIKPGSHQEPQTYDERGRGVLLGDGRVSALKAAITIMAHVDRLAQEAGSPEGRVPVVGVPTDHAENNELRAQKGHKAASAGVRNQSQITYCIDICPDTFELLASTLGAIIEQESDDHEGDGIVFHTYLIVAVLRILKANILQLLRDDISARLVESMSADAATGSSGVEGIQVDHDPGFEVTPDTSLSSTPAAGHQDSRPPESCPSTMAHASETEGLSAPEGNEQDQEEKVVKARRSIEYRFRDTLWDLRRRLLALLHSEPPAGNGSGSGGSSEVMAQAVHAEAAAVLTVGLELFFPSQPEQFGLLSKLISAAAVSLDEDRDLSIGGDLESLDQNVYDVRILTHFMLCPLLRRLCDDALTSKLIPYGLDPSAGLSACTGWDAREQDRQRAARTSADLLEMQVASLIDLIAQGGPLTAHVDDTNLYDARAPASWRRQHTPKSPSSVLQLNGSATDYTEGFDAVTCSDETSAASRCGDGAAGVQHLVVDFVLRLLKHIMHWAAYEPLMAKPVSLENLREPERSETGGDGRGPVEFDASYPPGWISARGRQLCDRAASPLSDACHCPPASWSCFIKSAQLTLQLSVATLRAALDEQAEEQGRRAAVNASALEDMNVKDLEDTIVGQLLPAVATGLLPFAHIPIFARLLLDAAKGTLELVDEVCCRCPRTLAEDEEYLAARNRDGSPSPADRTSERPLFTRGASGKLGSGDRACRNVGGIGAGAESVRSADRVLSADQETPSLSWILSLLKTLAVLAGRLAATLVIGDCAVSPLLDTYFRAPVYATWLRSHLFAGGCDPVYSEAVFWPAHMSRDASKAGITTVEDRATSAALSAITCSHARPCATESTIAGTLATSEEVHFFLEEVAGGRGKGKQFSLWISHQMSSSNASYRVVKKQASVVRDGRALERVERTLMAAMLRHSGLDADAAFVADHITARERQGGEKLGRRPPRRFARLWKTVAELVCWLWQARSELKGADAGQSRIDALLEKATNSGVVLLLFQPSMDAPPAVVARDCGKATVTSCSNPRTTKTGALHRWRKAVLLVRAVTRWRAIASGRLVVDDVAMSVSRFVRSMLHRAADVSAIQSCERDNEDLEAPGVGDLSVLLLLLLDNHRRANARTAGLSCMRGLVNAVQMRSVLADVLVPMGPTLETPRVIERHMLNHLEGVGPRATSRVRAAFQSLLGDLICVMRERYQFSEERGSASGTHEKMRVEGEEPAQTNERGISAPRFYDRQAVLAILNILGMNVHPGDWDFLEASGLFGLVSAAAAPCAADDQGASDVPGDMFAKGCSDPTRGSNTTLRRRPTPAEGPPEQSHGSLEASRVAAWTVFCALIIQLHGSGRIPVFSRLSPETVHAPPDSLMEVLHAELTTYVTGARLNACAAIQGSKRAPRRDSGAASDYRDRAASQAILEFAPPAIGSYPDSPGHVRSSSGAALSGLGASHRRRCQELVSGPHRLMNPEDGLVFPAEHLLSNPRGSDFSITFWLFLEQDRTGHHRALLARGQGSERWPVVLMRNTDNRIEVCFGIPSVGNLCERLTSKEAVQVNRWTHVGLISEHNKLRLYFNGALDCQRTSTGALRVHRHPLYVGRVPDGAMRLDGVRGGIEGSIANLRYFTRALSPIHVRIICEPGPPATAKAEDRHWFHLLASLVVASRSPRCYVHLKRPTWLQLLFETLTYGTVRLQQAVCRLLREVLPRVTPSDMAKLSLVVPGSGRDLRRAVTEETETSGACTDEENDMSQTAFPLYLLRLVGAVSWYTGAIICASEDVTACVPGGDSSETGALTLAEAISRKQTIPYVPTTIVQACVPGGSPFAGSPGATPADGNSASASLASNSAKETRRSAASLSVDTAQAISTLAMELVAVLQTLATPASWREATASALRTSLLELTKFLKCTGNFEHEADETNKSDGVAYRSAEDRLAVAAGEAALQVLGGATKFLCVGLCARIRETDQLCTILSCEQATSTAYIFLHPDKGMFEEKCVQRCHPDDLDVRDSDDLPEAAIIAFCAEAAAGATNNGCTSTIDLHALGAAFLRSSPLPRVEPTPTIGCSDPGLSAYRGIMLAQCRSRLSRTLVLASRNDQWASGAVQASDFFTELVRVSMLPSPASDQVHGIEVPADAETFAIEIRLRQMLSASCLGATVMDKLFGMMSDHRESAAGLATDSDEDTKRTAGARRNTSRYWTGRPWMGQMTCPVCGQETDTAATTVEHVLTKHSRDPRKFPCPICAVEKGDESVQDLSTHLQLVHFDALLPALEGQGRLSEERVDAQPPPHLVEQLMVIGFPEEWCSMALRENANDVVNASAWIVDNLDMLSSLNTEDESNAGTCERSAIAGPPDRERIRGRWRSSSSHGNAREGRLSIERLRRPAAGGHLAERLGIPEREEDSGEDGDVLDEEEGAVEDEGGGHEGRDGERTTDEGLSEAEQDECDDDSAIHHGDSTFDQEDEDDAKLSEPGDDDPRFGEPGLDRHDGSAATLTPRSRSEVDDAFRDTEHDLSRNGDIADGCVAFDHRRNYFPRECASSRAAGSLPPADGSRSPGRSGSVALKADLAGMDLRQLMGRWLRAELFLTVANSKVTLINILLRWPPQLPLCAAYFGSSANVVGLVYSLLFADQNPPQVSVVPYPCGVLTPESYGARHPRVIEVFGAFLTHLLRDEHRCLSPEDERGAIERLSKGSGLTAESEGHTSRSSLMERRDWANVLSARLVSVCLDELDAAAANNVCAGLPWVATESRSQSSGPLAAPSGKHNLALLQWLLDLLLVSSSNDLFTENVFSRLSNCLNSSNAEAKEVAIYTLTSITTKWCEFLATASGCDHRDAAKSPPESLTLPSPLAMEDAFQRHMSISRVRAALTKRIAVERRPGALFFTRYTQALVAMYVAMCRLQRLFLCRRQPPCSAGKTRELHIETELSSPTVLYYTDCTVALTWLPLHEGSTTSNVVYEVQMAARQLGAAGICDVYRDVYVGKRLRCRVDDLMPGQVYRFRVRAVQSPSATTPWSAAVRAETEQGVAFRFDSMNRGPSITVSGGNDLAATFEGSETWSTILGTKPFFVGSNYWEFRLERSATAYLFIGVATRDADLSTFLGGDDYGWGFIGDRALYHKRSKIKSYGERFGQGDTIGVTLNMDRGTLAFSRNGQDLGVAFEGLAGGLYPAVAFYNQGQRLALISSSFRCPGVGVGVLDSPLSTTPEDLYSAFEVMEAMVTGKALPQAWMESARETHLAWVIGSTTRYRTLLGFELQFDISDAACRRFALKARARVRTPRGVATVIGTCGGRMWCHVDGEAGAWFFASGEIWEGMTRGCFLVPPSNENGEGRRVQRKATASGTGTDRGSNPRDGRKLKLDSEEQATADVASKAFADVRDCSRWTPLVDGCIVSVLCDHADRHQVSVWNLTQTEVLEVLHPVRARLQTLLGGDLLTDDELLCRVSVLKRFNHELISVLPFVDLCPALKASELMESHTFCWGGATRHHGLQAGGADRPTRGLGPLLVCLRRSIFLETKQEMLSKSVRVTTTNTKKVDDEYDYPEVLPQIIVNRLWAAAGRDARNEQTRLRSSVFHQLYRELRCVDTSLLRMGYTHPMDDRQQRTFKIKFEGEGVDDYGGPYREIFTQVAAELTATIPSTQSSSMEPTAASTVARNGQCVLPILEPCSPSSLVGGAVDLHELFNLKTGGHRERALLMYRFLGQLLGIALRCRVATPWKLSPVVWKALVGEETRAEDLMYVDASALAFVRGIEEPNASLQPRQISVDGTEEGPEDEPSGGALKRVTWTASLDGEVVELRPEGRDRRVQNSELLDYARKVVQMRLHQGDAASFAMREGLTSVLPPAILPLFRWDEVQLQACGRPGVDIDLLQANTEYDDDVSSEEPHIKSFWRVLRVFDDRDRSQFLRFVWARSRLPSKASDFHQKFKIHSPTADGAADNPDEYLPKAHTCFFSINLPRYSSDQIMADKLRYTMHNCIEMDADFRLADSEMSGWDGEVPLRINRGLSSGSGSGATFAEQLS